MSTETQKPKESEAPTRSVGVERLVIRYQNADKFWLSVAAVAIIFGVLIPIGAIGMIMLLVAREYVKYAEGDV